MGFFIFALGIRHVGEHVARLLAESFPSVAVLSKANEDELNALFGIGPEVANAIVEYFQSREESEMIVVIQMRTLLK